jgi:hypothetical protein
MASFTFNNQLDKDVRCMKKLNLALTRFCLLNVVFLNSKRKDTSNKAGE